MTLTTITLKTSPAMRALIEEWEGCELDAYRDSVDTWTIGYGHTGADVHEGEAITQTEADQLLSNDLHKFEVAVTSLVGDASTSQQEFDALVSFAFNLGAGALAGSTLLRLHKAGDHAGAACEFLEWDHAGGQVLAGLRRRRQGEARVYLHGDYAS